MKLKKERWRLYQNAFKAYALANNMYHTLEMTYTSMTSPPLAGGRTSGRKEVERATGDQLATATVPAKHRVLYERALDEYIRSMTAYRDAWRAYKASLVDLEGVLAMNEALAAWSSEKMEWKNGELGFWKPIPPPRPVGDDGRLMLSRPVC